MGAAAAPGIAEATMLATREELHARMAELPLEQRRKIARAFASACESLKSDATETAKPSGPSKPSSDAAEAAEPSGFGLDADPSKPSNDATATSKPSGIVAETSKPSSDAAETAKPSGLVAETSKPSSDAAKTAAPSGLDAEPSKPSSIVAETIKPSSIVAEKIKPSEGCGHVFVLHCGLEQFAADALLVDSDTGPRDGVQLKSPSPQNVKVYEAACSVRLEQPEKHIEKSLRIADAFLEAAGTALKGTSSNFKRSKPLLGMPIPGAGKHEGADTVQHEGALIKALLPKIYQAVQAYEVDIALCLLDLDAYNVVQVLRGQCCPFESGPFWMLNEEQKSEVARLQDLAESGRLSLFYGAGVSFPSGLPSWGGLLAELAEKAGFSEDQRKELAKLHVLDQPTLIQEQIGKGFKEAVAECTSAGRYTPGHALLASVQLPAVTTNYDCLFEAAAESCGEGVGSLPWDSLQLVAERYERSVLKMHGCIRHPESIVLTRKDYMRYHDSRQALRGRVQDLLMTTEMLFIGFSMTDDNLHLIIDQDRKVLYRQNKAKGKMGTVLSLQENSMFRRLWDQDFHVVSFGNSWDGLNPWRHDCFLDLLASSLAVNMARASFILNPKYKTLLTEEETKLAHSLEMIATLRESADVQDTPSWTQVSLMLDKLGLPCDDTLVRFVSRAKR